jgi:hypothetical protein
MPSILIDVCLVAVRNPVVEEVARRWWNLKESSLDGLVDQSPKLWIGQADIPLDEQPHRGGPAGRVSELLFLRGSLPDYHLPFLDTELRNEIMTALKPRTDDPDVRAVSMSDVRRFLDNHEGWYLVTTSSETLE